MPQEIKFAPSAEDTDNSADTDCDREMMSPITTPPLLPEQGESDTSNNNDGNDNDNNNDPPATTSSSDDDEDRQASLRVGDVTRVTFSPDTNGTPDRHASITSNMDDDDNNKSNISPTRPDSSSSQKTDTKTQLQEQEERIIELSAPEHPSTNTTSDTPERLHVRDPEGVMASHGHSRKFSEDTMRKIVEVKEVLSAPRENENSSPDPPSPVPVGEPMIGRASDRTEEREEKQQEIVDSSQDNPSPETTPRENMVLSSIHQEPEEPLSPLEEDEHLQLVNESGGAKDSVMPHATPTSPPGSMATAPHRAVEGPYNGYIQQTQQLYPPLLPPIDSNSLHEAQNPNQHHPLQNMHQNGFTVMPPMMQMPQLPPSVMMTSSTTTKRKITFRLIEESPHQSNDRKTFLASFRRRPKGNSFGSVEDSMEPRTTEQDRGRITVSWYEGTTSLELQEHVRRSVVRKMELRGTIKLKDMRILDESVHPPEEIVLSPFIPDESKLLLRFTTADAGGDRTPTQGRRSYTGGAPVSPSAAPSPYPSTHDLHGLGLNANQLALLSARLKGLQVHNTTTPFKSGKMSEKEKRRSKTEKAEDSADESVDSDTNNQEEPQKNEDDAKSTMSTKSLHPEDPIEARLQQITELLLAERINRLDGPRQEKRQVIFVLANYFVLFLSLIAISVEIQARAPSWQKNIEQQLTNVQACAMDQDSLYECVSNGDFAGLVASVVLWISRSAATERLFLFGFESPKKLWTVVYESFVTAVCWGFSYIFIRRGMNPDTSRNFLQKYWKDACYGSLAGFNAAFMKHVLKNLIPQEAIEDAMQDRLKILSWLPSFGH